MQDATVTLGPRIHEHTNRNGHSVHTGHPAGCWEFCRASRAEAQSQEKEPAFISRWHVRLSDLLRLHRVVWRWGSGRQKMPVRRPKRKDMSKHMRNRVRAGDRGLLVGIATARCSLLLPEEIPGHRQGQAGL